MPCSERYSTATPKTPSGPDNRLAAIHRNAHAIGQFKADVLDKMTEPGAFAKAFDERSRYPLAQWCSYIPGRAASKRSMNPGIS